ncbi:MarR family transcriptional regulator [Novosphingobium bradum]|uniref:MarR family transcriptional regulator n=1 Tax=Novosphingobium bradum TaxID=1737444 RepID=A0ABV7IMX3_9SPHN
MASAPLAFPTVQSPAADFTHLADFAYDAPGGRPAAADLPGRAPSLAIYVDRPHLRQQLREDALVAGFRVTLCEGLAALAAGVGRGMAEVVLVDCPGPDAVGLAALSRLDLRCAQSGAQLIVATTSAGLEDVFGCVDQSQPQILVDAGETELALALGRAMALAPGRAVREMADEDRMQLLRLTEQVGRLAARLGGGAAGQVGQVGQAGRVEAPAVTFRGASADDAIHLRTPPAAELPDARMIRRILRQRQQRARFFDAELFADPAWDMLLDLTAARAEHKRVSVTSLCIASGVPPTTALRWISQLTRAGLFERVEDTLDRRRAFIGLSEKAADGMGRYFEAIGTGACGLTSASGANALPV